MKKYKALTCEFITKSYKHPNGEAPKLFFKGYFLFDDDLKFYREILQIKKDDKYNISNYRHTDKNMLTTDYYKNKSIREFRTKFLDLNSINKETYELKPENFIDLTDEKIVEINKVLITNEKFTKRTLKTIVTYFTGSNPSGAELNWKANPFIIVNNNESYNGGNLLNVLHDYNELKHNKQRVKWRDIFINNIKEIEEYSIDDFMALSNEFKEIFLNKNKAFFDFFSNIEMNTNDEEFAISNKHKNNTLPNSKKFKKMEEYYEFVKHKLISQGIKLDINDKNDISKKLLNYFKKSCQLSKKLNVYNHNYSIKNDKGSTTEEAHIIGRNKSLLKWIVNEKDFFKRIKIFLFGIKHLNCLNLTPNLHKNYDDNYISINPDTGQIYNAINDEYLNKWVHEDELADKREYLKQNWEYFQKHKKNL